MDVDGVLTNGLVEVGDDGIERRSYNVRDGIGITLGRRSGLRFGIITSSPSAGIKTRANHIGVELVSIGVADKAAELQSQLATLALQPAQVAFVGDDLVDLPAMAGVGLAVAVADAAPAVRAAADYVTTCGGGHGAIREICEKLVQARAPELLEEYTKCGLRL